MNTPLDVMLDSVWDVAEEALARSSAMPLLISAKKSVQSEGLARRIHSDSARSRCPFLFLAAADLPSEAPTLRTAFQVLMRAAAGGTVFLANIELLSPESQTGLAQLIAESQSVAAPRARLVTGTTVSLFDRVAEGTFSGRLFYRLNATHLIVTDVTLPLAS